MLKLQEKVLSMQSSMHRRTLVQRPVFVTKFVDTLLTIPHLGITCIDTHVLRELGSFCLEARKWSSGRITGLTVDLDKPLDELHIPELQSILSNSRLLRLRLVLYPEIYDKFRERLSELAALVMPYLSNVTELVVVLKGAVPTWHGDADVSAAAEVVHAIGPLCGPITHVSVSSAVNNAEESCYHGGDFYYTDVMQALAQVCASSLTHLTFDIDLAEGAALIPGGNALQRPADQDHLSCVQLDIFCKDALSSLTSLQHLDLGRGGIVACSLHQSLPASLTSLSLSNLDDLPSKAHFKPRLDQLKLLCCNCKDLRQMLDLCPQDVQLKLMRLFTPNCAAEEADLAVIVRHPAWILANSGDPNGFPVKELCNENYNPYGPGQPGYRSSVEKLSSLPIMPSVEYFWFACDDGQDLPMHLDYPRLLHHIPRTLPNLLHLYLESIDALDSDLVGLHACTSLRVMELNYSEFVTAESVMLLAAALPHLLTFYITLCDLVTIDHQQALASFLAERAALPNI